jgi:hypothetical protein
MTRRNVGGPITRSQVSAWRFAPVVAALMSLRGIELVAVARELAALVWDVAGEVPPKP